MSVISVKEHGARGDGQNDDTAGIQRAAALLQPTDTLYFPAGTYRISTPGTLVSVRGISKLKVFFDAEAMLLMDNLDQQGLGSGHAFYFRGYADGLVLEGIRIRWKTMPTRRSKGDGIRLDGPYSPAGPSDERTIKNITINQCYVAQAPQAGIVLMGCSDITIKNIELDNTWADGVHLNACRRFTIDTITGHNVADDQVALVTYYDPSTTDYSLGNRKGGPYTQPTLGEWSNYQGTITNVKSTATQRQSANGIRIAGALNVSVENLQAHRRKASIIIDAGLKGNTYGWSYQAARQIRVSRVTATECHVGVHVMSFNVLPGDELFWNFDVVLDEVSVRACEHDNLLIEKCNGVDIKSAESYDGRIRLINANDIRVGSLRSQRGNVVVHGLTTFARQMKISPAPASKFIIGALMAQEGSVQLANMTQLTFDYLYADCRQADTGCTLTNVQEATIHSLVSRFAQRSGLRIINCQGLIVVSALIESDQKTFTSLEVGGGNASSVSRNISLTNVVYKGASGRPDIRIQGGPHAPRQLSIHLAYGRPGTNALQRKRYHRD